MIFEPAWSYARVLVAMLVLAEACSDRGTSQPADHRREPVWLVRRRRIFAAPVALLSNNASSGGTCFGDSGGPNFLGNSLTVAA